MIRSTNIAHWSREAPIHQSPFNILNFTLMQRVFVLQNPAEAKKEVITGQMDK